MVQRYKKNPTWQRQVAFFLYFCTAMEQEVALAVEALRRGATLLYPTDTIWGLGCDARRAEALERLYALKGRDRSKSMLILCTAAVADAPWAAPADRPTTYILPREVWSTALRVPVADGLAAADGSLGIRMVSHPFCAEVIGRLGAPLVSTSANLSGCPSPQRYEDIAPELLQRVDHCVQPLPAFLTSETRGSRIIKIELDGSRTVIRP